MFLENKGTYEKTSYHTFDSLFHDESHHYHRSQKSPCIFKENNGNIQNAATNGAFLKLIRDIAVQFTSLRNSLPKNNFIYHSTLSCQPPVPRTTQWDTKNEREEMRIRSALHHPVGQTRGQICPLFHVPTTFLGVLQGCSYVSTRVHRRSPWPISSGNSRRKPWSVRSQRLLANPLVANPSDKVRLIRDSLSFTELCYHHGFTAVLHGAVPRPRHCFILPFAATF